MKQVVGQLQAHGQVERGFLGASTQPVTPEMAKALGLQQADGALVAEVTPDSPATRAGLRVGDVITSVGDAPVRTPRDLARVVGALPPGRDATLAVQRGGGRETLHAKLAELQDQGAPARARNAGAQGQATDGGSVGIALVPAGKGVGVAAVWPDSPAATAGLRPGDVIVGVQNRDVATPEAAVEAIRAAEKANGGAVALRVLRDGRTSFVALQTQQG